MAISKKKAEQIYAKGISKEEDNEALERATTALGNEQGTKLFNQAQAETVAERIITNTDYLYKSSIEKHNKKVSELSSKGLKYSKEFIDKKTSIENNADLTVSGKTKQLNELYETYNKQTKEVIEDQMEVRIEYNKTRDKIAKETLELVQNKASISDFTDKDMQYILYMVNKADNTMLLGLLEQYNFNPFLINIINTRDSKLSDYEDGKINTNKLKVVHPLAYIRENKSMILNNELYTNVGTKTLQDLIPTNGIPSVDPWANITDKKVKDW